MWHGSRALLWPPPWAFEAPGSLKGPHQMGRHGKPELPFPPQPASLLRGLPLHFPGETPNLESSLTPFLCSPHTLWAPSLNYST